MSLVGMWAVGMKGRDIGKVGKIVGLQGRKDLDLMEGFEKGLGKDRKALRQLATRFVIF